MNPMMVAQNRTARLVQEGAHLPRVAYSTVTPVREHLSVVEWDTDYGRYWSAPMKDSLVDAYIGEYAREGHDLSDIDHAAACWCFAP